MKYASALIGLLPPALDAASLKEEEALESKCEFSHDGVFLPCTDDSSALKGRILDALFARAAACSAGCGALYVRLTDSKWGSGPVGILSCTAGTPSVALP